MNNRGLFAQAPAFAGGGMVPASNFGSNFGGGQGGGYNPMMGGAMGGLSGILGGLFGDSGAPYDAAMDQYQKWANQAQGVQNPFLQAGNQGMGKYQEWLGGMQDPSKFINGMMNQYQESPWAKFQQQQSNRAGINAGSASGLSGSTPMMQQMQQNSGNIASQDMGNWLQNVLGINSQYGQGQQNLMQGGQGAANALTNMYGNMGQQMGQAAYGQQAGQNQDFSNLIGGGLSLLGAFL